MKRNSDKKARAKRTPEEKASDRKKDNERKKRGRTPFGKLKAIYPCKKCDTLFKLQYYADKCVCHAVFFYSFRCQILIKRCVLNMTE